MKIGKIVLIAATCATLAFSCVCASGCSAPESSQASSQASSSETIEAQPVEIYDVGFHQDDDGAVSYAFIAVNPNDDVLANSVVFSIEGYDAQGNMIMGSAETGATLYPNLPSAFAGATYVMDPDVKIETFEVKPSMESVTWSRAGEGCAELGDMFEFTNTGNSRSASGDAVVRGRITVKDIDALAQIEGTSAQDVKVDITVLLADTDGNIIAGGSVAGVSLSETNYVENESGEGADLPSASFDVTIPGAPSFKEAVYFATPAA